MQLIEIHRLEIEVNQARAGVKAPHDQRTSLIEESMTVEIFVYPSIGSFRLLARPESSTTDQRTAQPLTL